VQVALLNNLRAGRSGKQVSRILRLLDDHPEVLHVETESAHALPEALAELARHEVDLLVVNGGDGTLQHTLTEILAQGALEKVPMVAPLRGGRTNMTALDLGAHRDPVAGLASILAAVRSGTLEERVVPRTVLRVGCRTRRQVQYGMFFGAGMIHRAISLTHDVFPSGRSQGVLGAGLVTGTLILKTGLRAKDGVITPDKIRILLDGTPVDDGEFSLVIASSLDRLFLRMNPFWGDGPGGVRFTSMGSGARHMMRSALGVLRGKPGPRVTPENGYTSRRVERAELALDCGFTVDGEIYAPQAEELVTLTADRRITFIRG